MRIIITRVVSVNDCSTGTTKKEALRAPKGIQTKIKTNAINGVF